jgi:hypothetical protein
MLLRPLDAFRLAAFAALTLGVSACGGSTSSNTCYPGAASEIVIPTGGTNAPGTTQVTIALQARSDLLGNSWNLLLRDSFGSTVSTDPLTLISGTGLPHPFPDTDYFYSANIASPSTLPANRSWRVYLNQFNSSCTARYLATFSN